MDILEKSLEIWKEINDPIYCSYEKKFIFDNEHFGREKNSVPKSIILLDGEFNELHIIKNKNDKLCHQTILMTPQPLEKFNKMELSSSKRFVALIGRDSVSLIEICNISSNKTCKKIKEIFTTKDTIVEVKWYPKMHESLIILTKQSLYIFHIHSDLKFSCIYQHHLYEEVDCLSNSFGIKEEYIGCDFGSVSINIDDNSLFILKDSGEIYLLPELRTIYSKNQITPKKILFDPPSPDNYQDDFTSIIVLKGIVDVLVLANNHGTVQHALFINNRICVYETVTVEVASELSHRSEIHLVADETAYSPRYFLVHSAGIQSCILPWVIHLRLSLKSNLKNKLEHSLITAESTIFDPVIQTYVSEVNNQSQVRFGGLTVIRRPSVPPEMCIMQCREKKQLVKLKLRSESLLVMGEELPNVDDNIVNQELSMKQYSESKFLSVFKAELGKAQRMPMLVSGIDGKETLDKTKFDLVHKMNNITEEYSGRLAVAGKIFEHRLNQISSVAILQKDQLDTIMKQVEILKEKSKDISNRYERTFSRQRNVLKRLSDCSHKISEINGVVSKADKNFTNIIINVHKRLTSMNALLRSCKLRYSQTENFIDTIKKEESETFEYLNPLTENLKILLSQEDSDIGQLIVDVRNLLKR